MRAIRGRELRMYERLFARSFLGLLPPILLPSLSAASTKRLIRSLLPRPAFILDFPRRRLDRERDFYAIILWPPSLAEVASASPEQTSSCSPSFLPSFPLRTNCRPSVRALPALPSLSRPLRLTFSHNLASSRRSGPSVRPSPARSLARYCRRAEWLPVSIQSHCSTIS